ncbi:MAG: hypothetical protein SynsKO_07650 [Synoicihabitans sp.]
MKMAINAAAAPTNLVTLTSRSTPALGRRSDSDRATLFGFKSAIYYSHFYGTACRSCNQDLTPWWGVPEKQEIASQLVRLGGNLRRERIDAGLTQEKLAELADLNVRTL